MVYMLLKNLFNILVLKRLVIKLPSQIRTRKPSAMSQSLRESVEASTGDDIVCCRL